MVIKAHLNVILDTDTKMKFFDTSSGYTKHFNNNNKYVNLLINDKKLLKKYNEIWNKIKSLSKKEFDKKNCATINILVLKSIIMRCIQNLNIKKILENNKHCKTKRTK